MSARREVLDAMARDPVLQWAPAGPDVVKTPGSYESAKHARFTHIRCARCKARLASISAGCVLPYNGLLLAHDCPAVEEPPKPWTHDVPRKSGWYFAVFRRPLLEAGSVQIVEVEVTVEGEPFGRLYAGLGGPLPFADVEWWSPEPIPLPPLPQGEKGAGT